METAARRCCDGFLPETADRPLPTHEVRSIRRTAAVPELRSAGPGYAEQTHIDWAAVGNDPRRHLQASVDTRASAEILLPRFRPEWIQILDASDEAATVGRN